MASENQYFQVLLAGALALAIGGGALGEPRGGGARDGDVYPTIEDLVYTEDFEDPNYTPHFNLTYLGNFRALAGQTAFNGNRWKSGLTQPYNGVVTNATAMSGPGYLGPVGGPDPTGAHSRFLASPRGSVLPLTPTALVPQFQWVARLDYRLFVPTYEKPLITIIDWRMESLGTMTAFQPYSSPEGVETASVILGGSWFPPDETTGDSFLDANVGLHQISVFLNDDGVLDRPAVLARDPYDPSVNTYFATDHRIKTNEWFQIAVRQGVDTYSVWLRDSETAGDNASGMPFDTPGFEGEIFDTGWVQIFPGVADDPNTPVVEGAGLAVDAWGRTPLLTTGRDGEAGAVNQLAFGNEELRIAGGIDPPADVAPDYTPTDWYADNYAIFGTAHTFSNPVVEHWLPYAENFGTQSVTGFRSGVQGAGLWEDMDHTASSDPDVLPQALLIRNIAGDSITRTASRIQPLYRTNSFWFEVFASLRRSISFSVWLYLEQGGSTHGIALTDGRGMPAEVLLSAIESDGERIEQLHLMLPNPLFDEDLPEDLDTPANVRWDGVANRARVPVPLVSAATGEPVGLAEGGWHKLQVTIATDETYDLGDVAVAFDDVALVVDQAHFASLGAPAPTTTKSVRAIISEIAFSCGYEADGIDSRLWIDDISLDGDYAPQATTLTIHEAPFVDQSQWSLPFAESFNGYFASQPLNDQGAVPFERYGPSNTRVAEFSRAIIPLENPISPGDGVALYRVEEILDWIGTPDPSLTPGATVAVRYNALGALTWFFDWIAGTIDDTDLRARFFGGDNNQIGEVRLTLLSEDVEPWDGATPLVGQYLLAYEPRWNTDPFAVDVLDIETAHPGHGLAAAVTPARRTLALSKSLMECPLPGVNARLGAVPEISFDLFIESDVEHPRTRVRWELDGTSPYSPGRALLFGGPGIHLDINEDGYLDSAEQQIDADPRGLYIIRRRGPSLAQPWLPVDTGALTPVNTWMRITYRVNQDLEWTVSVRTAEEVVLEESGAPTSRFDPVDHLISGFRLSDETPIATEDLRYPDPIRFRGLGPDAAPPLGLDPLAERFNTNPAKYLYFRIDWIQNMSSPPKSALPDVVEVDSLTGEATEVRDLAVGDIVALPNDDGAGAPLSPSLLKHPRWAVVADDGVTVIRRGTWTPIGMRDEHSAHMQVVRGGITRMAPPYTSNGPYADILMGSIVNVPTGQAPQFHRVFVDNISLKDVGCFMDFDGSGSVDSADLLRLVSQWGRHDSSFNYAGEQYVDGPDLAALLAHWGPCD